jgi:hypothetical protein
MVYAMNDWLTAYSTVAEVSATLTGLLIVSDTVKLTTVSDETRRWMLYIAKRSFLDFLAVLAVALMFLVPAASYEVMGWVILGLGVMRVAWHISHWHKHSKLTLHYARPRAYVISMVATVLLVIAGVAMLQAWSHAAKLTYVAAVLLLFDACQNAWRLLTR